MEELTDENISEIREAWYRAVQEPCSKDDIKILVGKPISPTKRAPDAGDSAVIPNIFQRCWLYLVGRLRRPRPSAGNANRYAPSGKRIISCKNTNMKN